MDWRRVVPTMACGVLFALAAAGGTPEKPEYLTILDLSGAGDVPAEDFPAWTVKRG